MLKIKHVPVPAVRRDRHADHVHAAVHVHLRRRARRHRRGEYIQYLLPGILVQTIVFITVYTGVGLNTRHPEGPVRPLPLAPDVAAVAAVRRARGRRVPLLGRGALIIIVSGCMLGLPPAAAAFIGVLLAVALVLVFCFALSWLWIIVGMLVRTPESVMTTSFVFLMPLTFASDIFVACSRRCRAGCRRRSDATR